MEVKGSYQSNVLVLPALEDVITDDVDDDHYNASGIANHLVLTLAEQTIVAVESTEY